MRLSLSPHPDTPCTVLDAIEVQVRREAEGVLDLHYFAHGKVSEVRWPEHLPAERADRLWEASCFEAFLQTQGRKGYVEFNFSPSTRWQAYSFSAYREGMSEARGVAPPVTRTRMTERTRVHHVRLSLPNVPGLPVEADWMLGLSAVIEQASGQKSYWALRHADGKPDFHHGDCFACLLPAAGVS